MRLWVVVPAFNEAAGVATTLRALAGQLNPPTGVVIVDNASTDGTAEVVRAVAANSTTPDLRVVHEPDKGSGTAADTGMRYAIGQGATHLARTDADCLPPPGWTAAIAGAFTGGLEFVTGPLRPRTDEFPLRWRERLLMAPLQQVGRIGGRFRRDNRGPEFRGPFLLTPGANLALTADLYGRCGGFPRTSHEHGAEDRELINRVRRATAAYGWRRDVWVYYSMRRFRAYGMLPAVAWHCARTRRRRARPDIDVRLPPTVPPAEGIPSV